MTQPERADRGACALLFDLDGTLVDSIELILASFRHACRAHLDRLPPDKEWVAGIGTPLLTQLRGIAPTDAVASAMAESYRSYQHEHHDRLMREYPGVRETLALFRARGHPTALVTSKASALALRALSFSGLEGTMDVVVGCDHCTRHKPDPEPVLLALRQLGRSAGEAVFVGDSPHDVASGKAAGVLTIGALWGPFLRSELERASPDWLLSDIRELPALLERLELDVGNLRSDSNLSGRGTI
ncbi:MAG: HAD-IA family hydrolase [Gemmatimonadota bacterium]|nr:HAD-IA family hydrolase [Gemmatimonadota bacterium]